MLGDSGRDQDLALSLKQAGYKVHLSDGIWWQEIKMSFAKPVNPLRVIAPGESRPLLGRSIIGFSHAVPSTASANKVWPTMRMDKDQLSCFSLKSLNKGQRSAIKKALAELEFKEIQVVEQELQSMAEICASQAVRNGHGRPANYYSRRYCDWSRFIKREFSIPSRLWLGAYSQRRLVGYYYAFLLGDTYFISAAKSHTDALACRVNDGMLFHVIKHAQVDERCRQIMFGDWSPSAPGLIAFKTRYGFRRYDVPILRYIRCPMRLGFQAYERLRRSN